MILFKELKNPYIETCPFFKDFENILYKCRQLSDSLLIKKLEEQYIIYKNDDSDGLAIYEAEEMALAIKMIQSERNPELFIKEEKTIIDRSIDIPNYNTNMKGSPLFTAFEKEIKELMTQCSKRELESDLKRDIELYNNNDQGNLDREVDLYYSIQLLKTALDLIK